MRLGPLGNIHLEDVNLEDGFALVHGKGGRDRYVPIGRKMLKRLWRYMKKRALTDVNSNSYLLNLVHWRRGGESFPCVYIVKAVIPNVNPFIQKIIFHPQIRTA